MPAQRKPYKKPKITQARLGVVGRKHRIAPWFGTWVAQFEANGRQRKVYMRRTISPSQLKLIERLREHGINAEEHLRFHSDAKLGAVIFEDMGDNIRELHKKQNNAVKQNAFQRRVCAQLIEMVGKMHSLGVVHNHIRPDNLTMKNGKLALIDFTLARKRKINWNDPQSIVRACQEDWKYIQEDLLRVLFRFSLTDRRVFFEQLVKQYPVTEPVRESLKTYLYGSMEQRLR